MPNFRLNCTVVISSFLAVAGCQTTTGVPATPQTPQTQQTQAAQQVIQAVPTNPVPLKSTERTTQEVLRDGSVRTTTTTTGVSVNPGTLAATLIGLAAGTGTANNSVPAAANAQNYLGKWKLEQTDGKVCDMTLSQSGTFRRVSTFGCFDKAVFGASSWDLQGTELVIRNIPGDTLARFNASGPNRLQGGGMTLYR